MLIGKSNEKILIPALTAALLCSSAFALETSVAPKVTDIHHSPKTGLIVGNSYSFYNCGVHSYLRGLTRENKQDWKARIITISSGRLSYHDVPFAWVNMKWILMPRKMRRAI